MNDAQKCTYTVFWSDEDACFIATVAEFPSLSHADDTQLSALEGIVSLVEGVLEDYQSDGEEPPTPLGSRTYSGRFALRMTPETHRWVAMQAAQEGVSINRYINSKLAMV